MLHFTSMDEQHDFSSYSSDLLFEASLAVANNNIPPPHHLIMTLNDLSSPYGDTHQKLSSYFLHALFSRITDSGNLCHRTLASASDKICSLESTLMLDLKFQQVSPWTTFGHVACNGAILEAFAGDSKLHIVDVSNTYCTQWPTLLEAIATRADETRHLRLTTVLAGKSGGVQKVMKGIGNRIDKFARLMGVPFEFHLVHHRGDLSELSVSELGIRDGEALAVNLNGALRAVSYERRDDLMCTFRGLKPKIMTMVEEEADLEVGKEGFEFVRGFEECSRWFRVYLEALDESFPKISKERLTLEKRAGRAVMELIACSPAESAERRERGVGWSRRLRTSGFGAVSYGEEVRDDVGLVVSRYREGWAVMNPPDTAPGIFLTWKGTPVVWASAWKPI